MYKNDVLKHYKTQIKAANAAGVTQPTVSWWGEIVPYRSAKAIHKDSGGRVRLVIEHYDEIPRPGRKANK